MAVYLETNALRKLTDYKCQEPVYITIFSIFELLSGMSKDEFIKRQSCLKRIRDQKIDSLFLDDECSRNYIKNKYKKEGINGFAKYYYFKMFDSRIDEAKLSHAEAFVGSEEIERCRQQADNLFKKYNYKLFITAQAAIFAEAYFINGGFQNKNNASDLLHLLYLNENDKFVSNDKIYQKVKEACPELNFVYLGNEKSLSELLS